MPMPKKEKKFYTVWKGHKTGIFNSWDDCKLQIENYKGAEYKSFSSIEEANQFSHVLSHVLSLILLP